MKRIILTFALFVMTQFAMAQDAFKTDVLKVIEMSGAAGPMESVKDQLLGSIPQSKHAEFIKEFEATLPALYEKIAKVYMETYTHEDIKEMVKFYESPVGKKIAQNSGTIFQKSNEAGQDWGMQLQGIMMKYMQ
jgi:hypothetical protein